MERQPTERQVASWAEELVAHNGFKYFFNESEQIIASSWSSTSPSQGETREDLYHLLKAVRQLRKTIENAATIGRFDAQQALMEQELAEKELVNG